MGCKRKKGADVIILEKEIDLSTISEDLQPACYNKKEPYCRKEICDKWFDSCKAESLMDTQF
jgi:hypothetical protein